MTVVPYEKLDQSTNIFNKKNYLIYSSTLQSLRSNSLQTYFQYHYYITHGACTQFAVQTPGFLYMDREDYGQTRWGSRLIRGPAVKLINIWYQSI